MCRQGWILVDRVGIEPACDRVSGKQAKFKHEPSNWWTVSGLNRRPPACKAGALPLS